MSWQITTLPSAEPVTVAEVQARLRLTSSLDSATIAQHITTARTHAEKRMHQSLVLKGYSAFWDKFPWPFEPIRVPMPPLQSVTAIKYWDQVTQEQLTWTNTEYIVSLVNVPGLIVPLPGQLYPSTMPIPGAVEVDFTAGPVSAGQLAAVSDAYEGIRQLAAHIYAHPDVVTSEGLREVPLAINAFFGTTKVWVF